MTPVDYRPDVTGRGQPTHGGTEDSPPPRTAEEVFHRYVPRIYGVARRMLGNAADAEDVTQDVLLQVVRRLDTFRGEARFTTWLDRVTVNAALAHRRGRARRRERQLDAPLDGLPGVATPKGPERVALDRETWALVERSIARMPEMYRDVFVLAEVEGLANAEVGGLLGLSLPAVKSRLHRARAASGDSEARELLQTLEAREDLMQKLEEAFDREVLEAAKVQVRRRVAPHTWEAFRLVALEGLPAAEVAERVGIQVAMVYVAKSKVQRMLQEEIRELEGGS